MKLRISKHKAILDEPVTLILRLSTPLAMPLSPHRLMVENGKSDVIARVEQGSRPFVCRRI